MDTNTLEILNNLIIFDRQMTIYPKGHDMVERSCQKLIDSLEMYFSGSETLELVVIEPSISVNGVEIVLSPTRRNAVLDMFSKRGLLSITLFRGVSKSQIIQLFSCLQSIPHRSHILHHPDIIKTISEIGYMSVRYMQLGGVKYTENVIADSVLPNESKKVLEFLLYGSGSNRQPSEAAGAAIELPENMEYVVEGYSDLLKEALNETHSQSLREKQAFFRAVTDIIPNMPSGIRSDFLKVTLDNLSEGVTEERLESILDCMPHELLVDVVQMAKDSQRQISPAFIRMMNALRLASRQSTDDTMSDYPQAHMTTEQFSILIDRERHEDYISQDYGHQLNQISSQLEQDKDADFFSDMAKEYEDSFTPASIDCRVLTALSCLLGGVLAEDTNKVFNDYLKELALKVAQHGQWDVLVKVLPFDGFQSVCRTDEFIQLLENAYLKESIDMREALETIIVNSSEKNLPWVMNHYLKTDEPKDEERFLSLIPRFGYSAVKRILDDLLKNMTTDTLKKIMRLIQACNIRLSQEQMQLLLTSDDMKIRFRGIQLLIDQNPQMAIKELQKCLGDKNENLRLFALDFIKTNQYYQMVTFLLKYISVFYIDASRLRFNCEIINTLHALGSSSFQLAANRVQGFKLSLTPKRLKETQQYLRGLLS